MFPGEGPPGVTLWPGASDVTVRAPLVQVFPTLDELLAGSRQAFPRVTMHGGIGDGSQWRVISGEVRVSGTSSPRRSLTAHLLPPEEWSAGQVEAAMHPAGDPELHVSMVVIGHEGEWVLPLGVFSVLEPQTSDDGSGVAGVSLSIPDRTVRARRSLLFDAVRIEAGTMPDAAVRAVLGGRCPWLPLSLAPGLDPLPATVAGGPGADPWKEAEELAAAAGCDLAVDADGVAVMSRVPDPATLRPRASWGITDGVVHSMSRTLDAVDAFDGVITPWGDAGDVEIVPDRYRRAYVLYDGDRSLLTTAQAARIAANRHLVTEGGTTEKISGTVWPDYRLDAGDVVTLHHPDLPVGGTAQIESITFPLDGGASAVTLVARHMGPVG